jgi:Putative beta-barrel porin-2, OmpL-like. bbp2
MLRNRWLSLGALALLGGAVQAQDRQLFPSPTSPALQVVPTQAPALQPTQPEVGAPAGPEGTSAPETRQQLFGNEEGAPPAAGAYGPTPLTDVKILQNLIFGDNPKPCINISGWADFDYTYRSTGSGINNVAPVMNRFGNEALIRSLGLYLYKPLDPKEWSWGFNAILIAGSDAAFLNPTAGWFKSDDPRFGVSFTDLNLTAHLPILTDGGVDVKAGRQTTILGPMGALPWQRYFDSSDYAWYNMEEGRYTGVSAVWHITKRLDWYNGAEIGGWGSFFDATVTGVDYITNISYWLDEEAKKTKIWTTILTGPTGHFNPGDNTTVVEVGIQHNWSSRIYQIVDSQMVYSKAPVFFQVSPSYQERAYDVYTYLGAHMTKTVDINTRFEWYRDQDGGGYAGGFGVPRTDYFEVTAGPDYHPTKWVQFRPEIRYDYATNPNFGQFNDKKNQLSLAAELLFKF